MTPFNTIIRSAITATLALTLAVMGLGVFTEPMAAAAAPEVQNARPVAPMAAGIRVTVIRATMVAGEVDPRLASLDPYLRRSFAGHKRFSFVDNKNLRSTKGTAAAMTLPDGTTLSLTFLGEDKGFVTLRLQLGGLDSQVKVKDGGLFFQAGRVHEGGVLILAIQAGTTP